MQPTQRPREGSGLGREGSGLDGPDSAPSIEAGSGGGDEDMGEGVGQRGRSGGLEKATAYAEGLKSFLAKEMDSGAIFVVDLPQSPDEQRLREAGCDGRDVHLCCYGSPDGAAIGSQVRAFHTVSLGRWVYIGSERR